MTEEILHVHHWHRRKIACFDTETTKEDLPFIEACCRCKQEREIQPKPEFGGVLPTWQTDARQKSIDRLRKQEQKREFAGADATLRAYHERKAKKNVGVREE
jgi:hypothetical protein